MFTLKMLSVSFNDTHIRIVTHVVGINYEKQFTSLLAYGPYASR